MTNSRPQDITRIMADLDQGDKSAATRLLPLVYDELRNLAGKFLAAERPDHTLQPTALVHEAFLKLVDQKDAHWNNRAHFYCVAAEAMRRILVNHARDRKRLKRGGGARKLPLEDSDALSYESSDDLLSLDEALDTLNTIDSRKVQVVQLRYFGGFTIEETGRILDISVAQVKRDWTTARAFLLREIIKGEEE